VNPAIARGLLARYPVRKVWTLRRFSKTAQGQIKAIPLHLLWRLQHLIREQKGCGVIELFCRMKTDQAKLLIRENSLNFTEIANTLGYSSIHYFSRQFKKITGMTPSEYSGSIKKMIEEDM